MSDPSDGAGSGITGGRGAAPATDCPNCGARREGRYCARCGQNDRHYRRALPPMVWELVREAFEVDSRLVRTLKALVLEPGALSVEFSRDRRASYVTPVRLYLFVSLLFFFLLSVTTEFDLTVDTVVGSDSAAAPAATDLDALLALLDEPRRAKVREMAAREGSPLPKVAILELARTVAADADVADRADRLWLALAVDALYEPRLVLERALDNLPVAMFLMLPVYALLLGGFFRRSRRYFVEHLVFALHVHTFVFLVFAVLVLLPPPARLAPTPGAIVSGVSSALFTATFVYQFLALRRYYAEGRLRTAVKLGALVAVYFPVLGVALLGVFFVAFRIG